MIGQADLKVAAAGIGVQQANSQTERAGIEADHFGGLLAAGPNDHEREQLFDLQAARDLAAAGGIFSGLGSIIAQKNPLGGIGEALSGLSQAAALDAQIEGAQASFERQQESWQLQQSLAIKDIELGREQIALAVVQQKIAVQEREIAGVQLAHAAATAEFLATKFTNTELFEWMSGVLNQVYAYFLRQATALARLAQAQLAFERQEPNRRPGAGRLLAGPPDPGGRPTSTTDRRGLTGSERLLQDITRLDQYAFETNRRKLHLTQTLSAVPVRRRRTGAVQADRRADLRHPAATVRPQVPRALPAPDQPGQGLDDRAGPAGDAASVPPSRRRVSPAPWWRAGRSKRSPCGVSRRPSRSPRPATPPACSSWNPTTGCCCRSRAWAWTPSGDWSCPSRPTRSTSGPSPTCY